VEHELHPFGYFGVTFAIRLRSMLWRQSLVTRERRSSCSLIGMMLAIAAAFAAAGQTTTAAGGSADSRKVSRVMVWEPGPPGKQVALWPDGVLLQRPDSDKPEEVGTGSKLVAGQPWTWATYVSRPTMTVYRPAEQHSRSAILVLPGGGYIAVAMDLEGTEICDWVTHEGMTCIVLKYRVPQAWHHDGVEQAPKVQLPLQDAQRAIALLRSRASSYGIDPHKIGVIGFSAGGHLAAAVSNAEKRTYDAVDAADQESSRPDFAILLYPGHLWDEKSTKPGLTLSPWVEISAHAPPTLLIHAMNDPTDNVRHSIAYGLALNRAGVPVDMRLFAKGGHAFGKRPTAAPVTTEWPAMAAAWMRDINMR
jgi:acetyl esterase/lipase